MYIQGNKESRLVPVLITCYSKLAVPFDFIRLPKKRSVRKSLMNQSIVHVALLVEDYDDAISFYTGQLGFTLIEDSYQPAQDKRWVVVAPAGQTEPAWSWRGHQNQNRKALSVTRPDGACFCFSAPTIFGGIIRK